MAEELPTKQRILDTAERLFARDGVVVTSLRTITAEAGVNIAAVNYHFQSKESLIQAVFARRLGPINRTRIELLNVLEAKHHPAPIPVEDLLEAFIRPVLAAGRSFAPLLGRLYSEPKGMLKRVMGAEMAEIVERYGEAFQKTLPELPPAELAWRLHFVIGGMAHTLAASALLEIITKGASESAGAEDVLRRMIHFFTAGLKAPVHGER